MHAHLTEPPPAVTAMRTDLPAGIDTVIARAMAKAREERYESCSELIGAARSAILQQPAVEPLPAPVAAAAPAAGIEGEEPAGEPGLTSSEPVQAPAPAAAAAGG